MLLPGGTDKKGDEIMPNFLCYSRNRCTTVEQVDEKTLRSACRLQDALMDLFVEITVRLPDMEITGIKGEVIRSPYEEDFRAQESLKRIVGVRVGPGLKKIIKGLIGEPGGMSQLSFMVEECCSGVIISLTKDQLSAYPEDKKCTREYFANMARENPRLYNRCAAFAPGSPLVEGIDPP